MANPSYAMRHPLARSVRGRPPAPFVIALLLALLAFGIALTRSIDADSGGEPVDAGRAPPLSATRADHALDPQPPTISPREAAEAAAVADAAARKYRVARDVLREFIVTAYGEARRNRIDPMLVVAVMAVESRFNPIAQSNLGAKGLMQVIPHLHTDKFPAGARRSILDPRTNIFVGTRVLKEYLRRGGTETAGLQLYNGSADDPEKTYATRVLAERDRLREAARRAAREHQGTPTA